MSCCKRSATAVCCDPVSLVDQRPLRATKWDSPPSFRFRRHNTLGYRTPAPAARAFSTLAFGAGLN